MQKAGLRSGLKDRQERTEAGLGKDLLSHQGDLSLPGAAASPSKNGEGSPPKQVMTSSAPPGGYAVWQGTLHTSIWHVTATDPISFVDQVLLNLFI